MLFFIDFGFILEGLGEGLGGFGRFKIEPKSAPKAHSIENWIFYGFGEGLGRFWRGFGEGFGRVLEGFWDVLKGF